MSQATSQERKIPIVSLASTKGGVGKTTLAYVLATEVARRLARATSADVAPPATPVVGSAPPAAPGAAWRGRVTCIDADPNRTLAQVLHLTKDRLITCVESDSERLLGDLRRAQAEADLIVIDLEGTANQAMLYAAGKSDLVLVPAQPSRFDVVEAVKTVGVVRKAADLVGRDIAHRVVLSRTRFCASALPIIPARSSSVPDCRCCRSNWCNVPRFNR